MINQIQDETGAEISIEDDGTIYIGATDGIKAEAARAQINAIAAPNSFSAPLTISSGSVSMPQANATVDGYLSRVDWNTFNNKLSSSILTTAGDLLGFNGTSAGRVPAGANGTCLKYNDTKPFGITSGACTVINQLTTKGDLLTYDGSSLSRFAACLDGYQMVADSTQALGWRCQSTMNGSADWVFTGAVDISGSTSSKPIKVYTGAPSSSDGV